MNYPNYIINLEKILENLKTLKEEEFDFSSYVTKCDENGCGTVCCVVGWFPKWFPKSGFTWKDGQLEEPEEYESITNALAEIVGIPNSWVRYLFMGRDCPVNGLPHLCLSNSLSEVIDIWEKAIEYLKENPIICKYSLE